MKRLVLALLLVWCSQEPSLTWHAVPSKDPCCTIRIALDEQGREWEREKHCTYQGPCKQKATAVISEPITGYIVGIEHIPAK